VEGAALSLLEAEWNPEVIWTIWSAKILFEG
jgi:hypothetical protein